MATGADTGGRASQPSAWVLILAGGDGMRLRPLTTRIVGDARPKQFCPILDGETLLDRTRRRADLIARLDHQVVVVTRTHEPYYRPLARELAPDRLVVQPSNRGTGPGIVYPLFRIATLAGDVPVAVFPSDHYVGDDTAFMGYVLAAMEVAEQHPNLVVLLGIEADRPEIEYGWIETYEAPLPSEGAPAFPIRRFWEKPPAPAAQTLLAHGCLWNSFVMVGRVGAFLSLTHAGAPELVSAFERTLPTFGTARETGAIDALYARMPPMSFSDVVLARAATRLAAVRVKGVEWSDWGHPTRVLTSLRRAGREPAWLRQLELAPTA